MCNFKSAIVTRNGDIFSYDETDSHEVIITAVGFKDDGSLIASRSWVRVEFNPPKDSSKITDSSKWVLKVDETSAPDWWDEIKAKVREDLWLLVKRSMVDDARKCLIGGAWILLPGAKVQQMVGSRVVLVVKGADLSGANLSRVDLYGADLSGVDLSGADLSRVDLSGVNLSGADLSRVDLYGANLSGADLSGVDLYGVDLSRANLYGVNLSRANLSGVDTVPTGWELENGMLIKL